jgi:exonuclease III
MQAILLNIRHGGGRRGQSILEWLAELSPDVIALPEWRNNAPGAVLKAGLEAKGFQTATAAANGANGVLFAAKRPFSFHCATPPGAAKGALLVADLDQLRMMAAYFPQAKFKGSFFASCEAQAAASHTIPFLLLGDLHTGRNDVDVEGFPSFWRHAGNCHSACLQARHREHRAFGRPSNLAQQANDKVGPSVLI